MAAVRRKAARDARVDSPPWGSERVETSDGTGIWGRSNATEFRALLAELADAAAATLTGDRLAVAIKALRVALHMEEKITPRDLYARRALQNPGTAYDERMRTFANRMLGRADRHRGGRSANYPAERIVSEYRALTGQGVGDTSLYFSRHACGLPRIRKVYVCGEHWKEQKRRKKRHKPVAGCVKCDRGAFERVELPLSRTEAVTVIRYVHGFPNYGACYQFLKTEMHKLPEAARVRLPSRNSDGSSRWPDGNRETLGGSKI